MRKARRSPLSPFVPGTDGTPPLLAGRDIEQAQLKRLYQPLTQGRGAPRPAVLIGPRGNGKTVLLRWLEEQAETAGIETTWLTPDQIPTLGALAARVRRSKTSPRVRKVSVGANLPGVAGGSASVSFGDGQQHESPPDLAGLLTERAGERPYALLIDEAHTLNEDVGRGLLNAAQQASARAPFLFALAGTPDLTDALQGMDASFWTRANPIGVGLLTDDTATDAIAQPLASEGIALADESLWKNIVEDSQCYPYFVQAWGDELWNQCASTDTATDATARTNTVLSIEDVEDASRNVRRLKNGYYASRYEELAKAGLLAPARVIAERFAARTGPFAWEELAEIIEPTVEPGRTSDVLRQLAHAGFVWRPPDENNWSPGIPSLMNYVADQ